ncbi:Beta-hexosaminidase [Phycisphaerae bacterium RAS1]|nr:Beta-hexosaminidase [Phycisphaerae bacterium RAS1]
MVRLIAILIVTSSGLVAAGQPSPVDLVPRPVHAELHDGSFEIGPATPILVASSLPEARGVAEYLRDQLKKRTGLSPAIKSVEPLAVSDGAITLMIGLRSEARMEALQCDLLVRRERALIVSSTTESAFHGVQTFLQLLDRKSPQGAAANWHVPSISIRDFPRYPHRGMLLDCGRHFMDKAFVKRYIDLLAFHKMNVLHWHLTEDQGWRIEIRKYPKLTEIGAWRKARDDEKPTRGDLYGGFYTQEDVREIVAYAKSRFVIVIPEIEMPGHCLAALASYPELSCNGTPLAVGREWGVIEDVYCAGNERVFEFLQDVLSEVLELFPSELIHIGGDECPKKRWQQCLKCQFRMRAEGLKDEHELQSYFIRRVEKFLNSRGRRLVGWDEILEGGLAPNATVQSWRGLDGAIAAARSGHDVICSPTSHCYLDYPQEPNPAAPEWMGFIDLKKAYSFVPAPPDLTAEQLRHVLGLEGNIWTERAPQERVDHQVFPRLCALAEVAWSPASTRNWEDFERRMRTHYRRLDELGVTYCVPAPRVVVDGKPLGDPAAIPASAEIMLENPFHAGEIRFTLDGSEPEKDSPAYARSFELDRPLRLRAATWLPGGNHSDSIDIRLTPK